MCGVKTITTVLILLTTVLIAIATVLMEHYDRPNPHQDGRHRDEVPAHPHSRPFSWRRSAGKAGKRYGMMATKQTLTSPPALLPRPFPERFQTGNSREVPLFHFVRKKAKTKDKCNPFQTDRRLTLPAVTKNYFQETIRQFLFVRILGQNREKPVEKTAETAKTGKNTAVFHRIGLPHSG